ncbi:uncharacterized protein BJ212DRAFT_1448863 [Suillus subaureus]|uniref:Uncharacterized protein n=1 Tax=Suillus subaureus TaxID=48587 RepID=A0A9P7E1V4_9AGAM|nr:uncharacterized protein BJ212DRAFT_1448863 [Suillus subaureus]KAG1809157.1 hypothetical protein BJ212DRAFT_1448863 [Suillus subaureus]
MVFTLCNYPALLTVGVLRLEESPDSPIEDYPLDVQWEHMVFMALIDSYPGLLDHLTNGEEEDLIHVGELLGKGASGARGNNTKTLKSAVLEWLVPRGQAESLKTGETAVHGDQWPMFLYAGCVYDPEDPWKGLLRSKILICGFKHVFTSPSLVDKEPKAMRSSNTYLHSMKSITKGSLAYIAMQVQFLLSSSSVFSHTDTVMNSENFYHSILDLLEDSEESEEVGDLMMWWTHHVFPNSLSSQCSVSKNSALLKIQEKCAAL